MPVFDNWKVTGNNMTSWLKFHFIYCLFLPDNSVYLQDSKEHIFIGISMSLNGWLEKKQEAQGGHVAQLSISSTALNDLNMPNMH